VRDLKMDCGNLRCAGWPEYLIEAWGLGTFMISACVFDVVLEHPSSPLRAIVVDALARRALMGLAMGLTALGILYSPWGKRSGAHINPAVTLAFLRLGRIRPKDACFYALSQTAGAVGGVLLSYILLGKSLAHESTRFAVTKPGARGTVVAFMAEVLISTTMMATVLLVSSTRYQRYTGLAAGILVALFITFEAPLSGMSINPARTIGSAVVAGEYQALWVYLIAPIVGMLGAAEIFRRRSNARAIA
jgi:aquaporin Z